MKKYTLLILSMFLLITLLSCKKDEEIPTIDRTKENEYIKYREKPNDNSTPKDYTPLENVEIAYSVILDNPYYRSESKGVAVTNMVIKNKQSVYSSRIIKGKEILFESITSSKYKKEAIQRYYDGENVLMRRGKIIDEKSANWNSECEKYDYQFIIKNIGYIQSDMTGYLINDESIIKSEIIESDYYYTAKLTLNPNIACKYTQLEVMFNAGAEKLPKYEETVITISMNENWQVQQIIMHDVYEIKVKLGVAINAPVDATIEETFYYDNIEIPNEYLEFFTKYL